jgi:peroxiredoxin
MKTLAALIFCFLTLALQAQVKITVTDSSVVKDSTGKLYPLQEWRKLFNSGDYGLRPENPNDQNTALILMKLSENAIDAEFGKMPKPKESNFFTTGKKLELFTAKDLNGNPVDLKNAKGKIIVLNFWFINCGPCRREIPDLNKLVDQFSDNKNVLFIGVSLDSPNDIANFLAKMPFKYTMVEGGGNIASNYGVRFYPTHVVLDPEGKIYFHTSGLAPNTVYWVRKSIKELLQKTGKDVAAQ